MVLPEPLFGPEFSSYDRNDVEWLMTDVTDSAEETTGRAREQHIQNSGHYSESLPVEYNPDAAYIDLFDRALSASALAVARSVAVVSDAILESRGSAPVLVSLARAGTPAGILIKRWLMHHHGIDVPHFTMSIMLDRGLDPVAVQYLRANTDCRSVVFVDGWTGKGSISRELRRSVANLGSLTEGLRPELAVLADPAGTARFRGTRGDVLIPSACLNSTVSGLVSRTVYNSDLIPPGAFHGAKFYSQLEASDRSRDFIDAVVSRFDDVTPSWAPDPPGAQGDTDIPTELRRIARKHNVGSSRLIKPGVCETTRVLLRRVPTGIVLRQRGLPEVLHLEHLARVRNVPISEDPQLQFLAVGLIEPMGAAV